jgi:hypothetical protein
MVKMRCNSVSWRCRAIVVAVTKNCGELQPMEWDGKEVEEKS